MEIKTVIALFFCALAQHRCQAVLPELRDVHKRFEFLQSFKGPYLIDSQGNIPYWNHGGSSIASDDSLRVCPSVRSHRGWAWAKNPLIANHWLLDISLRVTGRLKTGADGMAIWVTDEAGTEGPVYGNTASWKGLGLILDSFDNDGLSDNPKIQVVLNDRSKVYEHRSDGNQQQVASCVKDFRNRPYPFKIRITYIKGVLEVWVHDGVSIIEDDYELCARVENHAELYYIPKEAYVGVSAATGGLSDDHDVISFLTYSVLTQEERAVKKMMENETAFNEMTDKYNKMSGEFDQKRDAYRKEHPDVETPSWEKKETGDNNDWQKRMEMEQGVLLVADMQVALQKDIRAVGKKVDILLTGGSGVVDNNRPPNGVPNSLASDLSQIRTTESNILHQIADLKASVDRSVPVGDKVSASEQMQPLYETKNMIIEQRRQLEEMTVQLRELTQAKCPGSTSCLSSWLFIAVVVCQGLVFIGHTIYVQAQERNAKKFF